MQSVFKVQSFVFLCLLNILVIRSSDLRGQDPTVIKEADKSLVRIHVNTLEGGSQGSGFVVSVDGLVVTNVHVMAGAQKAIVFFPNGRQFEIEGTTHIDEARDICIVKLKDAKDLHPIKLATELPLRGEEVTALGSPFGLSFTVTKGIVSAIREEKEMQRDLGDPKMKGSWVQVDAALSPGNSGGPLINAKGEVVAMSTRASGGGRAQNLNFGISIKDINEAIATAASAKQVSLVAGVGKIKGHEVPGGAPDAEALIRKKDVPDSALAGYIQEGRDDFRRLAKRVRQDASKQEEIYRLMRKGETGIPTSFRPDPDTAYMTTESRRGKETYYFRNEKTKRKYVSRKSDRVAKLKALKKTLADSTQDEALAALLRDAGPSLDPQTKHSAGFLEGAVVMHAFDDHVIAVGYDDSPFLMWVESTAGLSTGQELDPTVAYVAGTETMQIPGESTMSVTVLQVVSERQLEKTFVAAGLTKETDEAEIPGPGSDGFMIWKSKSGHELDAKLLKNDGTHLHLQNRDGKKISVPIEKIDAGYLKWAK